MVRLKWGQIGVRTYEAGIDRGVLYPSGSDGVAWPGLVGAEESYPTSTTESKYFDGYKYMTYVGRSDFKLKLSAIGVPTEFAQCIGILEHGKGLYVTQQVPKTFGLSYRTFIGNDTIGINFGYKIHIVYNALATPTTAKHVTLSGGTPDVVQDWVINTIPHRAREYVYFRSGGDQTLIEHLKQIHDSTSHLVIDTQSVGPDGIRYLEDTLYGTDSMRPQLPTPAEVLDLIN